MTGVTFGELYFNMGNWEEQEFIKRLRLLLCGSPSPFEPYQKGGGNDSWVLDENNNWWLRFLPNKVAQLTYRYPIGLGLANWEGRRTPEDVWKGLEVAINTLMHLRPLVAEQEQKVA